MQQLFLFLIRFRAFFVFLALELVCFFLIVNNNSYQSAVFFNSSSALAGNVAEYTQNINDYFILKRVNEQLAQENALLKRQLIKYSDKIRSDSLESLLIFDRKYETTAAEVVDNSVHRFTNYITIDKGSDQGIEPEMAVISAEGIVGKVMHVSDNFSVVKSVLHTGTNISTTISRFGNFCTLTWDGKSPEKGKILYVPRHYQLQEGDSIFTSGYNSIFPKDILVGTISDFSISDGDIFYDISVELSTDFQALSYVFVIKSFKREEFDSLQNATNINEE
ncbi:rod shape-determining protein MreC [Marinigracilibium pacificum]|uniref:Cell shape-determining protein MreC n=1 Tax=Marinigracilibium pacificum TaxID=2729599 RepID=A0A848IZR1_9BACT|nr:rod shape-determining protein MreC [Marinigracilibium pacificum]NMM49777.1 rod shape-determining protein MreC [Marinigracilibium pacificum]